MSSWSQQAQQNKYDTWKSSSPSQLHQQKPQQPQQPGGFLLHQNGRDSHGEAQRLFPVVHAVHKSNPVQHNMSQPDDMMAPQSISFIGDEDTQEEIDEADNFQMPKKNDKFYQKAFHQMDDLETSLGKLNITSGSRTYRIPSPTSKNHPGLAANSFQSMESQNENDAENEKGFYISFDNDVHPKRPKPPLRTKKSPKKDNDDVYNSKFEPQEISKKVYEFQESFKPVPHERLSNNFEEQRKPEATRRPVSEAPKESQALIIGNDEKTLDPVRANHSNVLPAFLILLLF